MSPGNLVEYCARPRIAKGSGVTVTELNTMLNQFNQTQTMMKKMGKMGGASPAGLSRR